MGFKLSTRIAMQISSLIFTCSLCLAQNQDKNFNLQTSIDKARDLIAQKKYTEATQLLTVTIDNNPESFQAYLLRSKSKYGLADYLSAIEDSRSVLKENFKADSLSILTAYMNIGICYNSLARYDEAIGNLKIATRLHEPNIYYSLAYSYLNLGQLDSAYIELNNMLTLDPNNPSAYYAKGQINLRKEKYKEAINEFDKAIDLYADYAPALQNRGEAKRQLGDNAGACTDWRKCIELGFDEMKPYLKMVCK